MTIPFDMRSLIGPMERVVRELNDAGFKATASYAGTGTIYLHIRRVSDWDRPYQIRISDHGRRVFETEDDWFRARLAPLKNSRDGNTFTVIAEGSADETMERVRAAIQEITGP